MKYVRHFTYIGSGQSAYIFENCLTFQTIPADPTKDYQQILSHQCPLEEQPFLSEQQMVGTCYSLEVSALLEQNDDDIFS